MIDKEKFKHDLIKLCLENDVLIGGYIVSNQLRWGHPVPSSSVPVSTETEVDIQILEDANEMLEKGDKDYQEALRALEKME